MSTEISSEKMAVKSYLVNNIKEELGITGKGDSPLWENAVELSEFIYPWENETPPLTSFKSLHNKNWIYFLYTVEDKNILVYVKTNHKSEVVKSDRVEIFFRSDDKLLPYYGLELDPHARVYDYKAEYKRKFDDQWSWPKNQLIVKTSQTTNGYIVEIAISKQSLKDLGLLKNNTIEAGLFRGECIELIDGAESKIKWISWVRPNSDTPDFHIPSAFGVLSLKK
ncbi:MAG: carbohydrate-binding family 9-like protein [Cyclobacteriaceae bacterium]|nr:carbohydrate-binding family 9-like protein [Cyclobacteriaceae bacterium]